MATRSKIYYSENQIQRELFTNGGEYMTLDDWKEYVGFYHRYSSGEIFTQIDWDPLRSKRLVRLKTMEESTKKYYDLQHFSIIGGNKRKIQGVTGQYYLFDSPRAVRRKLTDKEIKDGSIIRYFVSKRNEKDRVFFEIDEGQTKFYNSDSSGMNQYLYELVSIPWKVDGPEYDIFEDGILKIPGVVSSNRRIISRFSEKFRILRKIITSPREMTVYE